MSKNIILLLILLSIYFMIISLTIFKLKDIKNNPSKYEHEDLINETNEKYKDKWDKYCKIFQSLSHQYSFVNFALCFIFVAIGYLLILAISKTLIQNNERIFMGTQLIGVIALLFLAVPLLMGIIPLSIKKPFFVVTTLDIYNEQYRPRIYKKAYLTFLIIFIITFPFVILSCNNYGYYNSHGIGINTYFQIKETFTSYDEVKTVEIYVQHNKKDQISSLNYVVEMKDGKKININNANMGKKVFTKSVIQVHEFLKEKGQCEFIVKSLSEEDIKTYKAKVTQEEFDRIIEIFNVNN